MLRYQFLFLYIKKGLIQLPASAIFFLYLMAGVFYVLAPEKEKKEKPMVYPNWDNYLPKNYNHYTEPTNTLGITIKYEYYGRRF